MLLVKPESDVIAFKYATSQESASFGMYNYATNTLIKGIGANDYVITQNPIAILGNDRLLMLSVPGVDAGPTEKPSFKVLDTNNKELADIAFPNPLLPYFHEAYAFSDTLGTGNITFKNTAEHSMATDYQTYQLDLKTFTFTNLTPQG